MSVWWIVFRPHVKAGVHMYGFFCIQYFLVSHLYQSVSNKIRRLLTKYCMRTIHIPMKKSIHMLRPVNNKLGLKVTGIYCIPGECSKVYVGQMGRIIGIWCEKYGRHKCQGQPEKSLVAEHRFEIGHGTSTQDKAPGYMDCLIKKAAP